MLCSLYFRADLLGLIIIIIFIIIIANLFVKDLKNKT